MTATVANFNNLSKGLVPVSRGFALQPVRETTTYGYGAAHSVSRLWLRMLSIPAAMSGEARVIWSMSGISALGFVVLLFGGGTL